MKRNIQFRVIVFLVALFVFIAACSTQKHYKTLSLFFDGVPNPSINDSALVSDSTKKADSLNNKTVNNKRIEQTNIIHFPYGEHQCTTCHNQDDKNKTMKPQPELCYTCHDDFAKKYKVLHGPVASGGCTKCHNPHTSKIKKLLRRENQELCLFCHNKEDVLKNEIHTEIGETSCMECHNPHGGEDRFIFK